MLQAFSISCLILTASASGQLHQTSKPFIALLHQHLSFFYASVPRLPFASRCSFARYLIQGLLETPTKKICPFLLSGPSIRLTSWQLDRYGSGISRSTHCATCQPLCPPGRHCSRARKVAESSRAAHGHRAHDPGASGAARDRRVTTDVQGRLSQGPVSSTPTRSHGIASYRHRAVSQESCNAWWRSSLSLHGSEISLAILYMILC